MERILHVRSSSTNSIVSDFKTCSLGIILSVSINIGVNLVQYFISSLSFKFSAGGPWLITDMERMESIFELEPSLQVGVNQRV